MLLQVWNSAFKCSTQQSDTEGKELQVCLPNATKYLNKLGVWSVKYACQMLPNIYHVYTGWVCAECKNISYIYLITNLELCIEVFYYKLQVVVEGKRITGMLVITVTGKSYFLLLTKEKRQNRHNL